MQIIQRLSSTVTSKILLIVMLVSSVVTIGSTAYQLWFNYNSDLELLEKDSVTAETSISSGLGIALWNVDKKSVHHLLNGVSLIPSISYVKLASDITNYEYGEAPPEGSILREIEVIHQEGGVSHKMGRLQIGASNQFATDRLWNSLWLIFSIQLFKTLFASMLIFFLVQLVLAKPLRKIASHLDKADWHKLDNKIEIQRVLGTSKSHPDEIDNIVSSINLLKSELFKSYQELHQLNLSLEGLVDKQAEDLEKARVEIAEQQQALANSSKLSALGEMAGGIAHEINNPLAIISYTVQLLEMDMRKKGEVDQNRVQSSCQKILETVDRAQKVIKGLREVARDGSNESLIPTQLDEIVGSTLALCESKLRSHGVQLEYRIEEANHFLVDCRPVQISQVLLSLLNNAYDAVSKLEERWIKIVITDEGNDVVLSVTDSGRGIPEEKIDKIMLPFYTTKPIGEGTGLGLSVSKSMMMDNGGDLSLDITSTNTKFDIRLQKSQRIHEAG